jgi:hypothetical protein
LCAGELLLLTRIESPNGLDVLDDRIEPGPDDFLPGCGGTTGDVEALRFIGLFGSLRIGSGPLIAPVVLCLTAYIKRS